MAVGFGPECQQRMNQTHLTRGARSSPAATGVICAVICAVILSAVATEVPAQSLSQKLKAEGVPALAQASRARGDAIRGAILFAQQKLGCVNCHASGGRDLLGPDLTRLGTEATDVYLVESLLLPSKVIKQKYEVVNVLTRDGKTFTGRVINRGPQNIRLRESAVTRRLLTLNSDDIEQLVTSKKSGMPDALLDQLSDRQQFLDLVRYMMELAAAGPAADSGLPSHVAGGGQLSDELQGLALMDALRCAQCHRNDTGVTGIPANLAPDLTWSAGRVNPAYIARFIEDPQSVKPRTSMPDVMAGLAEDERRGAARAITHYLVSLSDRGFVLQAPDRIAAGRGHDLFHSVGCVACHSPRRSDGSETLADTSVPLGKLEQKYNIESLATFLEQPHLVRPSKRMPDLRLSHWEALDIAHYLLSQTRVSGALRYTLFRGDMHEGLDRLPGKEQAAGIAAGLLLTPFADEQDDYAVVFDGFLEIAKAGTYTFALKCADAGRLSVAGKTLISLAPQPEGGPRSAEAEIALSAGQHAIRLTYLQIQADRILDLQWKGPGRDWETLPTARLSSHKQPADPLRPFVRNARLAAEGKRQFQRLGCNDCHATDTALPRREYTAWTALRNTHGCLSGKPGDWPRYELPAAQRSALAAAVARQDGKLDGHQRIAVTLSTFRCLNCHQRGALGGVAPQRDTYFRTTNQNLGPQGRIPPSLTAVGSKLKPSWMRDVLVTGRTSRPYMRTRMPQYGAENVGHLVALISAADRVPEVKFAEFSDRKTMREAGWKMAGNGGLNCVACHTFQRKPAVTMSALDLTEMSERLHKSWFYRYMLTPQALSPNTVMPSFWPGGRAMRRDILTGDSQQQIEALWQYLQDGRQARVPRGLVRQPIELLAGDEAVMLRRSYPGIGKRGIGVGYPLLRNLVFDAEQMRLALIWKGKFADPGGVWRGQGHGNVRPLGSDQIRFPPGPDLDDSRRPWKPGAGRPQRHRFQGYHLDKLRRPAFQYQFDNVEVEDYPVDVQDEPGGVTWVRRRLTFLSDEGRSGLVFRAAGGKDIETVGQREFLIDKTLRVRVDTAHNGQVVKTLTGKQLRIPLNVPRGTSTLILEYTW